MQERIDHMGGGGLLATAGAMAVTYGSGQALSASGWLSHQWATLTSGQASLIVGVLSLLLAYGPRVARWLWARRPRRGARG